MDDGEQDSIAGSTRKGARTFPDLSEQRQTAAKGQTGTSAFQTQRCWCSGETWFPVVDNSLKYHG